MVQKYEERLVFARKKL